MALAGPEAESGVAAQLARQIGITGGKAGPGRGKKTPVVNTRLTCGSTNAPYLVARIKRDRPDVAERLAAGEFRSARAAAIEAGIVSAAPRVSLTDPKTVTRKLIAQGDDFSGLVLLTGCDYTRRMNLSDAKRARTKPLSSQESGTKLPASKRIGRPRNQTIAQLMREKDCSRSEAYRKLATKQLRKRTLRQRLASSGTEFNPLIKPSDNWNFFQVVYERIDGKSGHGYIPGDLYANCLFYFTKPGDLVVAPMAGSGQVMRVYEDRAFWMRPQPWDFDLRMFDLTPRGPYASLIRQSDLARGFPPVERPPDYVVLDVPYLGACRGQYSAKPDDIANMDEAAWTKAMNAIAVSCASVEAKLCTVVVPNWVNSDTGDVTLCTEIVRQAWERSGYALWRKAYATKHIQAGRADRIAVLNNRAKRTRQPLSDISEVLTFRFGR